MTLKKLLIYLSFPITAVYAFPAQAQSVMNLSRSVDPQAVVIPPESTETDVNRMRENWYLRNYAALDTLADLRPVVEATDEEIIERLKKLPTTIEMPFNKEVKAYIKMYAEKKRGLVENMLGMSSYYMPIFEQALEEENMPLELKYLPVIESAINPVAVSKVGATGLWQFMPATAKGLGLEINSLVDERRDPVRSSKMAARYLKQLYNIYGDWSLAIAAYNCGPGNVNKAIRRAGDGKKDFWEIYPFLPAETRGYVPCFIAACYVMNYYQNHNISRALTRRPIVTDSVHISKRVHFQQIADVLNIPVEEIRILNPQYRADVIPGDVHPYPLVLPSCQTLAYVVCEDSIIAHDFDKYNHRAVVEPSDGTRVNVSEDGEYTVTEKTRYHKVARGETINSIARKYGVTVAQIQRTNGIRSVKRGQTIRIVTTERVRREVEETPAIEVNTVPVDSLGSPVEVAVDSLPQMQPEPALETVAEPVPAPEVEKKEPVKKPAKKQETPKSKTITVRSGDNLSKIAKREHTTVQKIKQLNGLTNDNIRVGQKLRVK